MNRSSVNRPMLGIITGGLAAGVLDILYAFVLATLRDGTVLGVLQSIASGLLGRSAYQGGLAAGMLGLALHFGITVVAAAVYFVVVRSVPLMRRHYVICGLAFGVLVYLAMNFVVLPLSAVPFVIKYTPWVLLQGFVSHALLVGLPISVFLHCFMAGARHS
jgi:hypothetical protein